MVENNKNHEHTSEPMHLDSKKFQTPALEGMKVELSSAEQKKKDEEMQKLRKKIDNLKKFINKSMIKDNLDKEIAYYKESEREITEKIETICKKI